MAAPDPETIDPRAVFVQAIRFDYTLRLLRNVTDASTPMRTEGQHIKNGFSSPWAIPEIVMSAFCTELYLKSLILIDDPDSKPRGHALAQLFKTLSDTRQRHVTCNYNREITKCPAMKEQADTALISIALPDMLEMSSEAFDIFRYIFEGGSLARQVKLKNKMGAKKLAFGGEFISKAVQEAILDIKPDWIPIVRTLDKIPSFCSVENLSLAVER